MKVRKVLRCERVSCMIQILHYSLAAHCKPRLLIWVADFSLQYELVLFNHKLCTVYKYSSTRLSRSPGLHASDRLPLVSQTFTNCSATEF